MPKDNQDIPIMDQYDEQSKQLVARSVVCPFNKNKRVKFDPCLSKQHKRTASNGGDVMPKDNQDIPIMDQYDEQEPEPEPHYFESNVEQPEVIGCKPKASLRFNLQFTDVGETPFIPCTTDHDEKHDTHLKMSYGELNIDNTIEHFPRTGKVPYTAAPFMTTPRNNKNEVLGETENEGLGEAEKQMPGEKEDKTLYRNEAL